MIPAEAVEAATRAIVASLPNDAELETHRTWATGYAIAALEAAIPHLQQSQEPEPDPTFPSFILSRWRK